MRDGFSERVLFPGIIADGLRVQGFEEDLWVDVGSPERYMIATRLLLDRTMGDLDAEVALGDDASVADDVEFDGHVLIGHGVTIGAGTRITGPTVIGHDTIVGAGATIEASIIWEEARIGAGARVTASIIAAYAGVGDRATVTDAVLGNGAEVEEGHALEPGAKVMPGDRV